VELAKLKLFNVHLFAGGVRRSQEELGGVRRS
jgi:hypothetical protein